MMQMNDDKPVSTKRTRHERKMARNAAFARQAANREAWERMHPVLSGKVKITDYGPPPGRYVAG